MKKVLIGIVIVLAVLIGCMVVLPIIFKDPILKKVKTTINDNIDAQVEFADFKLSFFRSFPNLQAELIDFTVIGEGEFEGDTLAAIGSLATDISISDLFSDDDLPISSISMNDALVNLRLKQNGAANWDIAPASDEVEEVAEEESDSAAPAITLESIVVNNFTLRYTDETMPMTVELNNLDLDASGAIEGLVTQFDIESTVEELVLSYDSVTYLSNTSLSLNSELMADLNAMAFTFGQSTMHLNDLPIELSGDFSMPSDSMFFDIAMAVPQSNFETILALVPASYQSYLEGVTAQGDAGFTGAIKGYMYGEDYPAMNLNMYVRNGDLQYPDLPAKVENINVNVDVSQPQGSLDGMRIEATKHVEIKSNPIDAKLLVTNPISNLAFDMAMEAKVDFNTLKEAIPMDSVDITGMLDGNFAVKGTLNDVEQENFTKIIADGSINFDSFSFSTPEITETFYLNSGNIKLDNQRINFDDFDATLGNSDFQLDGYVSNYLAYAFLNQTLNGQLTLNSTLIDANQLMAMMPEDEAPEVESTEEAEPTEALADSSLIFQVPDKLNLAFNSTIDQLAFSSLNIKNIDGLITVRNKKLQLDRLTMDMLGTSLGLDGSYAAYNNEEANFDFNFDINKVSLPILYESAAFLQNYVPVAENATGYVSANVRLAGMLDDQLSPKTPTLNGGGRIDIQNLALANAGTISKLNSVFKKVDMDSVLIEDFSANIEMVNGLVTIKPFDTSLIGQKATIGGTVSADMQLDMLMDFDIKKDDLNSNISDALDIIPGSSNIDEYPIGVKIKGDVSSPTVTPDLTEAQALVAKEIKNSVKENAGKVIDDLGSKLKDLF